LLDESAIATAPARFAAPVTPDDDTDLEQASTIYVGVAGDVTIVPAGKSDLTEEVEGPTELPTAITFKNMAAGDVLPVLVRRVMATGTTEDGTTDTTAQSLVACW